MEHPKEIIRAKQLRKIMPEVERILWSQIQNDKLGFTFRRQQPIGPYYVDFICFDKKLVIELDGGQHADAIDYDNKRTDFIKGQGWTLIRIPNGEVKRNLNAVLYSLRLVLNDKAKATDLFKEKYDLNPNKDWLPPPKIF